MTRGNNTKKYVFNSKKYSFSLKVSSFVLFSYLIPSQKHDKLQIPDCDLHHLPGKIQGGIHAQKNKILYGNSGNKPTSARKVVFHLTALQLSSTALFIGLSAESIS